MNAIYQSLAEALHERLEVIADRAAYQRDPAAHLARLQAASDKVTAAARQLPDNVPPELSHYLARCSYDKALAFIEQQNSSAG
jgi:Mg-chelatase subunit ChlI